MLKISERWSSLGVQQVKDLTLSLLWLGPRLWHGLTPWLGNFLKLQTQPKKEKTEKNWRERDWSVCRKNSYHVSRYQGRPAGLAPPPLSFSEGCEMQLFAKMSQVADCHGFRVTVPVN